MNKTMIFNIVAMVLAIILPALAGIGYTGEVPAEWVVFIPAGIAVINMILKALSKTEAGKAMNI